MSRRDQIMALLPATFPQIVDRLGLSRSNASRLLADALYDGALYRVGPRRCYTYIATPPPAPPKPSVTSVFDLGARV